MREDVPIYLKIKVYDLLPPSYLSSFLNVILRAGIYHSSVAIALPLNRLSSRSIIINDDENDNNNNTSSSSNIPSFEFAFGGHDQMGTTGIFVIPEGDTLERMPGLSLYCELKGKEYECFGENWKNVFEPKRSKKSIGERGGGSNEEKNSSGSSSLLSGSDWNESRVDLSLVNEDEEELNYIDDEGISDGTECMTRTERRIWRTIEFMKKESEWEGTNYNLLGKNCNTFTQQLVWRLTGVYPPNFINRAAWAASTLPCLIPPGWIDSGEDLDDINDEISSVIIAPPRADQMNLPQVKRS